MTREVAESVAALLGREITSQWLCNLCKTREADWCLVGFDGNNSSAVLNCRYCAERYCKDSKYWKIIA